MGLLSKIIKSKDNIRGHSLSNSPERDWFSSGSYAFNGILSGDIHKGIPSDVAVALVGPSNSGKSFMLANFVKSALDKNYEVIIFDSERAVREEYYRNLGCDVSKIWRVPVGSVDQFKIKAYEIIGEFYKNAGPDNKLFVGLDSLGNLAGEKEMSDVEKQKSAADQGTNAKGQNSAFRIINALATDFNFPFVYTNHVYAPIGDLFAQRDKISGGNKAIYSAQVISYFERLVNKEEIEDEFGKTKKRHVGMRMKITTMKNRNYIEEKDVTLDLRFDQGINVYSGLLPFAIAAGVIENKPRGYLIKETGKTVFDKNLYTPEVFTPSALERINEWFGQNGYSSNLSDILQSDVVGVLEGVTNEEESQ
jgi:RecA/RadA recombinase